MNKYLVSTLMAMLISAAAVGCAPAPFLPVGKDTYTITQTSAGGIFKSMTSLRAEVIGRVNEFAKSNGKVAERVSENESPAYPGHMPSFTYTFRLVSGTALEPGTESSVSNRSAIGQNPMGSMANCWSWMIFDKKGSLRKRNLSRRRPRYSPADNDGLALHF